MSTYTIPSPFAAPAAVRPAQAKPGFWQRTLQVFDEIGRERAERELRMLAKKWDQTSSPELARQARTAAAGLK